MSVVVVLMDERAHSRFESLLLDHLAEGFPSCAVRGWRWVVAGFVEEFWTQDRDGWDGCGERDGWPRRRQEGSRWNMKMDSDAHFLDS